MDYPLLLPTARGGAKMTPPLCLEGESGALDVGGRDGHPVAISDDGLQVCGCTVHTDHAR